MFCRIGSDDNLAYLAALPAIERLSFYKTNIGDAGMKHLARVLKLSRVWLGYSEVGDDGLRELGRIRRPITVDLSPGGAGTGNTRITPRGIEAMKTLAPYMTITP